MSDRICARPDCGAELVKKPGVGRWPKYCPGCRPRKVRPPGYGVKDWTVRECLHCGEVIPARADNRHQRYCSRACVRKASELRNPDALLARRDRERKRKRDQYEPVPRTPRACVVCGSTFEARQASAKFCSKRCYRAGDPSGTSCGFQGCDRPHQAKGLCSLHYKAKSRAEGRVKPEPWSDRRRDDYHRRRAAKKGSTTGMPVVLSELAVRDGFRCQICRRKVDMALTWPHRMSPSIDHVVPLSLGGAHDPANCQLAHLTCNTSKGNRVAEVQLALVG